MSPFGLPFDLGVIFGVVMIIIALLIGRNRNSDRREPHGGSARD